MKNAFGVNAKCDLMHSIKKLVKSCLDERVTDGDGKRSPYIKRNEERYGATFKNELRLDGRMKESRKISLSTMKGYLSKARKAIADSGLKHHLFEDNILKLKTRYPLLKDDLNGFEGLTFPECLKYRKSLLKSIRGRLNDGFYGNDKKKIAAFLVSLEKVVIIPVVINGLSLTDDELESLSKAAKEVRTIKKASRIKIDTVLMKKMIIELLNAECFRLNAVGVGLATGRRLIEIIIQGGFKPIGKYEFMFSGQAKNSDTKPYKIPTLAPTELLTSVIQKIRSQSRVHVIRDHMNVPNERYTPNEIFNNHSREFTDAAEKYFSEKMGDKKYGNWMFKDVRAINARLSFNVYENECLSKKIDPMDEGDFFSNTLGHVDELSKENYKSFYTSKTFERIVNDDVVAYEQDIKSIESENIEIRLNRLKKLVSKETDKRIKKQLEKLIPFVKDDPTCEIDSKFLRETIKGKTVNHKPFLEYLASHDLLDI